MRRVTTQLAKHHLAKHHNFRLSVLALAVATALPAFAEEIAGDEHLDVIGRAAGIDAALAEQRRADRIESVVHADGIGQLPDDNAAEALQRIPGLSLERDQGEGRFVTVRGLAPDLNSVTINGTLVPAPESDRRAVALDVLPAELVQSLTVVKTLTPDMDANSLGGTIEVESLSGFDHDGQFYSLSAEASYDDNVEETSPKLSGAWSDRFGIGRGEDNLGVALAFSWQDRDFGSDNVETGGAWDFADDGARLEELDQRDYVISRERSGVGLNFDLRPDDLSSYYLRTLYSRFEDNEVRNAAGVEFEDAQLAGDLGDADGWRELKAREETQEVWSVVFGGERLVGLWTLAAQAGMSRASEENPGGIASAVFEGGFSDIGFSNTEKPKLSAGDDYYDPANFELDAIEWEETKTTDTERNIRFDIGRDVELGGHAGHFKFGGKFSRRDKDNDAEVWVYEDLTDYGFDDADLTLDNFAHGSVDYSLNRFGPGISGSALRGLIGGLDRDEFYDDEESRINDFDMREEIAAGYAMQSIDIGDWQLIAGVRYEGTDFEAEGTGLNDGDFEATKRSNDYDHWLPGLHARFKIDDATQLRAAWTNSVIRPTFGQLAPGFVIDGDEAEFGNPELDPLESSNIDLGVEHYFGRASVVSAFVFYKQIDNFIYASDIAGSGAWIDFDEAVTFVNGDSADLYGIELAWSQQFSSLPAPWNGLLAGANLTLTSSDADITGSDWKRSVDLPNQSDTVGNLSLGWEGEKLHLRVAANYKSEYLMEVAAAEEDSHDLYSDEQLFVDFSAAWFFTPNLQLTFEAQNLTDEHYYVYTGSRRYNAQYEEYGPTYKLGLTLTRF